MMMVVVVMLLLLLYCDEVPAGNIKKNNPLPFSSRSRRGFVAWEGEGRRE
jgi:hypothetical protein